MRRNVAKVISDSIRDARSNSVRSSLVVFGPSGIGKTFLLRSVAKELGVRYLMADVAIDRDLRELLLTYAVSENAGTLTDEVAQYFGMSSERVLETVFIIDGAEALQNSLQKLLASEFAAVTVWVTNRPDRIPDYETANTVTKVAIPFGSSRIVTMIPVLPLGFDEFVDAIGHPEYASLIRAQAEQNRPIPEMLSQELADLYFDYMLVGGYPQAVSAYINTRNDISALRLVHGQILAGIKASLCSGSGDSVRLHQLFDYYGSSRCRSGSKFRPGDIVRGLTVGQFSDAHRLLVQCGYLIPVAALHDSTVVDRYVVSDTGLLRYLQEDYDSFFNTEENGLPYDIYVQSLYGELYRAGITVLRWESGRSAVIPAILKDRRTFFTIEAAATKRSRSSAVFCESYPEFERYHITYAKTKPDDTHHKIQWFELWGILKPKKR